MNYPTATQRGLVCIWLPDIYLLPGIYLATRYIFGCQRICYLQRLEPRSMATAIDDKH